MVEYFTKTEAADKSNLSFYSECVKAAADVLKSAGFVIRFFEHVDVIEIILFRYIKQMPKIKKYGPDFKVNCNDYGIKLYYNHGQKMWYLGMRRPRRYVAIFTAESIIMMCIGVSQNLR